MHKLIFTLTVLLTLSILMIGCQNNDTTSTPIPFDTELQQLNESLARLIDRPVDNYILKDACEIYREHDYKTKLTETEMDDMFNTTAWDMTRDNPKYDWSENTRSLGIVMTGMSEFFDSNSLESYCNSL